MENYKILKDITPTKLQQLWQNKIDGIMIIIGIIILAYAIITISTLLTGEFQNPQLNYGNILFQSAFLIFYIILLLILFFYNSKIMITDKGIRKTGLAFDKLFIGWDNIEGFYSEKPYIIIATKQKIVVPFFTYSDAGPIYWPKETNTFKYYIGKEFNEVVEILKKYTTQLNKKANN